MLLHILIPNYFSYLKSRGFAIVHSTEAAMVLCPHIWKGKQDTWSHCNYTGDWTLHAICLPFSLPFSTTSEISKIFMGSGIFWLEAIVFSKPGSKLVRATYSGYACLRTARSVCVSMWVCGCMCACMCVCMDLEFKSLGVANVHSWNSFDVLSQLCGNLITRALETASRSRYMHLW